MIVKCPIEATYVPAHCITVTGFRNLHIAVCNIAQLNAQMIYTMNKEVGIMNVHKRLVTHFKTKTNITNVHLYAVNPSNLTSIKFSVFTS